MNANWLFPKTLEGAKMAQQEMAQQVQLVDEGNQVVTIAGMDISNTPFDASQMVFASAVVLSYPSLEIVEVATHTEKQEFPYIPGLLGFREVPALVHAFEKLTVRPDVVMVDGHGVSHPRGLGVASHLGVLLDIPTIGVAKSILVGQPKGEALMWKDKEIGRVLRTKQRCNPLIVSAGNKISLKRAVQLVIDCLRGYRLPEPTRQAHLAANAYRKGGVYA